MPDDVVCKAHQHSYYSERERGGGAHEDDLAEGTGGEEQVDPVLNLTDLDVEARGDDAGLVEAAVELHDDLAGAVVVDDLELADVAWDEGSAFATGRNDEGERKGGERGVKGRGKGGGEGEERGKRKGGKGGGRGGMGKIKV